METKKNPSVDLTNKSSYFFSIGLLIAMSLVVMAFEWRQQDAFVNIENKNLNTFEVLLDIPITKEIPPPPVPRIINPRFIEVEATTEVDPDVVIDVESSELTIPSEFTVIIPDPEVSDIIVNFPEETASPKGGFEAFYRYVSEKVKYPAQARRMGIEGRVFVEFVINKDGSLSDVKAVKGIGAGCDEEAVRIVQSAPSWNPGKQRGKAVKQRYTLPIIFKLG